MNETVPTERALDDKPLKIRSFVAVISLTDEPAGKLGLTLQPGDKQEDWLSIGHASLSLWFRPRQPPASGDRDSAEIFRILLLGDDAEWDPDRGMTSFANAASLCYDASSDSLTVYTSIVGLPPVFLYKDSQRAVLTSDIYMLVGLSDIRLDLDPAGVVELGRIGKPVGYRTLFKNTTLLPAGAKVVAHRRDGVTVERVWSLPGACPVDWESFLGRQVDAFTIAVQRMDVNDSFLSLTAGLDTRTIFALLADQDRLVPAVTMSGVNQSLDARTAAQLCRAYGVSHSLVTIGDEFARNLAEYVQQASRLSGGLASLQQAPDVYLYHQLGRLFAARLSGNLGNQVGRGGTEGVGMRCADLAVLSPALRDMSKEAGHWLLRELNGRGTSAIEFILQQEIPFSSVGNFTIGSHFAVQKSPYADRTLVETLSMRPVGGTAPSGSLIKMRFRDLKHRFFGEPESISFQRRLLNRLGGFAATYPINYGWRATGGVSPTGLLWGAAAFAGMAVQKWQFDDGLLSSAVERIGLATLHDFHRSARWLRHDLQEFARDTLNSRSVLEAGIFDVDVLTTVTREHFDGKKNHHETVAFALDVALAQRIFCSNG